MAAILIQVLLLLYFLGVFIAFNMIASLVKSRRIWVDPFYSLYSWIAVIALLQEYRDRDN